MAPKERTLQIGLQHAIALGERFVVKANAHERKVAQSVESVFHVQRQPLARVEVAKVVGTAKEKIGAIRQLFAGPRLRQAQMQHAVGNAVLRTQFS